MSLLESPETWKSESLENLLIHVIGGDWGKAPDHQEQGYQTVACIRGSEFRHWSEESGRTAVPRKVKANSLDKRSLLPGDILLEISGGGPDQPVGRTVLINQAVIDQFDTPVIGTNFLRLLRPSADMDKRFLNRYLEFFYSSGEVIRYQGGSNNLRNLKFKDYSQISVPVPPVAEQKIIADILDTLLAQVDNTKARLERIPKILKRFRQSVLAAAVSGRLTDLPEERFETAPIEQLAKQQKYSLGIGPFGSNLKVSDYRETGHPLVFVREIRAKQFGDDSTKFVSGDKFVELKAHRVKPGDILITKMGDPPGDVSIYPLDRPEAVITSDCIKLSVDESVYCRDYVAYAMQ